MTAPPPRRPRRRRKRTWAAILLLALWLLLAPVTAAHALYLAGRGYLPAGPTERLTLFHAWPASGDSPAARFRRYLGDSYHAGIVEREFSAGIREIEADLATIVDPESRDKVEGFKKGRVEGREYWRFTAPFLFR